MKLQDIISKKQDNLDLNIFSPKFQPTPTILKTPPKKVNLLRNS